jgi:hypothetical protein
MEILGIDIAYVITGVVIAVVIFLIYRKSQKPGKAPRVGPKGTHTDPKDR